MHKAALIRKTSVMAKHTSPVIDLNIKGTADGMSVKILAAFFA